MENLDKSVAVQVQAVSGTRLLAKGVLELELRVFEATTFVGINNLQNI